MASEPAAAYTKDQVAVALNRAADEVSELDVVDTEAIRDAINLLTNAGLHYLDAPEDTLSEVIDANWDQDSSIEIRELLG